MAKYTYLPTYLPTYGIYERPHELPENCWKVEIKVFRYCAISHENKSLSDIFFPWCSFKALTPA